MSLSAAAIRMLADKGLSADDIADIAEANEPAQSAAAIRQKRFRDNKRNERNVTRNVTPPPNDIYSNPPGDPSEANASPPPFADRVADAWNSGPAAAGARKAVKLDTARKAQLRARVKDHGEDAVFVAISNLAASKWHCGENDRGWRANLGWFLEPKNFLKALEMGEGDRQDAANDHSAKPADPADFAAFCRKSAERCRQMGREQEAVDWEAKARGEQPRRNGTGPPRAIGSLLAQVSEQAGMH